MEEIVSYHVDIHWTRLDLNQITLYPRSIENFFTFAINYYIECYRSGKSMEYIGATFSMSLYLNHLNLSRNPDVGNDGIINFCKGAAETGTKIGDDCEVKGFSGLKYLDLSQCNLGAAGVQALSEFFLRFKDNKNRISLKLNENPIGNEGMRSLANMISPSVLEKRGDLSSLLVSLSLQKCNVDDEGIQILTSSVTKLGCLGLQELDLANNKFGEKGAKLLATSFQSSSPTGKVWSTLNELNFAGNKLGCDGIIDLCEGICNLEMINSLNLCETSCTTDGAIAAIRLKNVKSLRLFNNKLGSTGFDLIAPLLEGGHSSLVNLDLGGNSAKGKAVASLLKAFLMNDDGIKNSTLQVLEIGGNEINAEAEEILKELERKVPLLDIARDRPKQANFQR